MGFDHNLYPGEDVDLDIKIRKLGYRLIFTPNAIVYHYRPDNIAKFVNMMKMYGKSASEIFKRHGFARAQSYIPFITIIAGLLLCLIWLWDSSLVFIILGGIFITIMLLFWTGEQSLTLSLRHACLLIITLVSWNIGFLVGLFSSVKRLFKNTVHSISS
jgi:cellulose synthase/poly-beta-1,6-N-acetylglucosamine synthase-like glycosyltransferase